MATLSDFYYGDPYSVSPLSQYYLGSGAGATRFNQNYWPTNSFASRGIGPEKLYVNNMGVFAPAQMGDFTPSAGLMGEMQPLSAQPQVQAAPQAELPELSEPPLQIFGEAYPDLFQQPTRTAGLLGDLFGGASALDEYMTPEQRAQMQNQGVMAAAMQLLAASGPSRVPVGLGQALGQAYGAGQQGYTAAQQNLLQSIGMKQKMDEYKRARDIEARISGALVGEGGAVAPGGTITAEQAINAPGGQAGPTVARAAMIGAPSAAAPMSQADLLYNRYMNASNIAAQYGETAKATALAILAEKAKSPQETQGDPYRAADGNMYIRLKSGASIPYQGIAPAAKPSGKPEERMINGVRTMVQFFDDGTYQPVSELGEVVKPMGSPFKVTDASGKQVLLSQMSDGTYKTLEGFGPQREMVQVDVGGSIKFIDKDKVAAGASFTKGLAPQIVGSADTGFYVYGGGGGGGTTVGGRAPATAAAGAPGAAPAPGGRQAAPGMTQIIPGTSFKNDEQLRGEFTRNMEPFVKLAQAFEKVQVAALNPSGAGDISLIYGYMKILDPGSTVMQGEQASAQNAGSVPESIRAKYNSIIAGDKLDPNVRADFLNQARLIVESQRTMANDVRDRYSELAQAYGLKPEQIVFDPFKRIKPPGEVVKSSTPIKANDWWNKFDLLPKK